MKLLKNVVHNCPFCHLPCSCEGDLLSGECIHGDDPDYCTAFTVPIFEEEARQGESIFPRKNKTGGQMAKQIVDKVDYDLMNNVCAMAKDALDTSHKLNDDPNVAWNLYNALQQLYEFRGGDKKYMERELAPDA